ncbi:RNA polymerase sigma factor SigI [Peribacillus sp. NPDC097264]|uniref:RNA polymerase sigma factor SigI n=1 Tax=unclassified Peribacillus TaxID=2675266 RepID=UPI003805A620
MLGLLFTAFKKKRSLESTVLKIQQGDLSLRNDTIESFKPFIAKTVSSVCRRYIYETDDEFSIGLIAFNEAIDKYSPEKGSSLLAFAETLVKRRVIDYLRSQSRRKEMTVDLAVDEENNQNQSYFDDKNSIQEYEKQLESEKRSEEIHLYINELKDFGLSFDDLVEVSPKHADARKGAIMIAKMLMEDDELKEILFTKKRLPVKQLEGRVEVSRKTIERNRKYIIAVAIILNGDFLYLNEYIKGVING